MSKRKGANFHCCVPMCNNDSRYDESGKLSFHRIPTDPSIRKEWIIKIRRDVGPKFQISDATVVCSAHFESGDIKKTITGLRKLVPGAVPKKFAWTTTKPKRREPEKRSKVVIQETEQNEDGNESSSAQADISTSDLIPLSTYDHDYHLPGSSTSAQLEAAQAEISRLQAENLALKTAKFGLERFQSDASAINFYTGFKDYANLKAVFNSLLPTASRMIRWTQMQRHRSDTDKIKICFSRESQSLSLIDEFFMFLCRVRQGFPETDLAIRFCVSQSTVSRAIITWANYLYAMLGSIPLWLPRSVIDKHMPECFTETYPQTRVILDCTEIKVQTPSSKVLNSETFSNYKSHTTFKSLVGITPNGMVSFVSTLFTGSISDKQITARSGVTNLIEPNDQVMADKGFLISDLLEPKKAGLVIPPFLGAKGKFSKKEVAQTHEIARLRIHVERAIRRVKEYHIFDGVIPLNLAASINQIWTVCTILTNFKGPLF